MRLGEIDLNLKPLKPKFYLCKPDKTVIASLNHIYDTSLSVKLGKVNELNFTIPVLIESDHEQIENPLIEKIRHRYLVKMEYNHQTEYFVFLDQNKQFDETNENISYKLFGLGYLLGDKHIRDYEATSKTLLEIVNEVLEFTNWQVGYMDSYFNKKFRSHEISSQTVLQAIYELAEKFSAIIIWNTVELKIDFHMPVNIGMNRGLKFREGKYLESFSVNSNAEEMVTRLKVYGKEGLTFRKLSPTGANYIESFDWYIYPFERDASHNIIAHSDYFSDDLCIALENYGLAIASIQGLFDTLTASLTAKQDEIQQAEQTMTIRKSELTQILDELDISNSYEFSDPNEHALIIQRRVAKEAEITVLRNSIATLKNQETSIQNEINSLRTTTLISSHLSPANLIELNDFIIEKEYTNDTIVDEEDLLEDGIRAFNEMREPKVNMSLEISNFLSVVEAQHDWHKLSLGDIVKLESKRLRIGIEAKIIEINYDFETDSISLTIANEKELKDDYRKLLDLIYSANATSTAVSMDKFRWDMIEEANTLIDELYLGTINTIKNNITAGYQQNIEVSERGIIIKSPSDPLKQLVIQNGVLALSNNGGNTWSHAITSTGIVGETIIGRLIMGSRLIIEDEDGIIRFSGSLQEIFDENNNLKVAIGNYAPGKYGIKIDSGSLLISSGNSTENLVDKWNSAEQNAKDYMDSLRSQIDDEIEDIETRLEDLSNEVGEAFEDGIVTAAEKEALKTHIQQLNTEKIQFDSKYNYVYMDSFLNGLAKTRLSTAKTDSSVGYDVTHTRLITAINNAVADNAITEAERTTVSNAFTAYRTALSTLVLRLEEAISSIENARSVGAIDNAKVYADSLKEQIDDEIEDIESRLTGLSQVIEDAFEDDVISISEKEALKTHIQQLNSEKAQFDTKYNFIYSDTYLTGTAKTNLGTAKTNTTVGYDKAHTDLIAAINNAIADNIITESERTAVTNAFTTYRTRLSTLTLRIEEAIASIEIARSTSAENNAKAYADSLKIQIDSGIEDLEDRITDLSQEIENALEDGVVSIGEKEALRSHIQQLNNEKAQFDTKYNFVYADAYLVGTAKSNLSTAKTDSTVGYDKAHTDLITVINNAIADGIATEAEKTAIANAFTTYRTRLSTLVLRIDEAIVSLEMARSTRTENSAKTYADSLKTQIDSGVAAVNTRVTNLNAYVDGAFSDGIINLTEREALETHIQHLNNEKVQFDSKYTSIYNNINLVGAAKTNLATAKTNASTGYDKAHTDLITAINNAIADSTITEAERTAVTNGFTTYRSRLATLTTRLEEAITSIETALMVSAENNAKSYADGLKAQIDLEIGDIDDRLNGLSQEIEDVFEDGVVSLSEKEALKTHIQHLNNEKAQFDAKYNYIYADSYLTGAAKTDLATAKTNGTTGYDKAHTDLIAAINNAISDNIITETEKTAVTNAFTNYRTRLSTLTLKLEEAITSLEITRAARTENSAKAYADALKNDIDDEIESIEIRLGSLSGDLGEAFADNIINAAEKESLRSHIQNLNNVKAELDSKYTSIYNNAFLNGTPKSNLATAKNNTTSGYDKAHTDLIAAINNAIADDIIVENERTAVANAFVLYRTRLSTLATRFEEAIDSIKIAMMTLAESNAKTYADNLKAQLDIEIEDIEDRLTGLSQELEDAFEDGIISISEKESLKTHIQQLNSEKTQFDTKYNFIYSDSYLTGTAKTNLATAKTDNTVGYDKAHSDLIATINNAIADNAITEAEKLAVTNAFTTYRTRLSTLILRIEEAIAYLEGARSIRVENSAKAYADGLRTQIDAGINAVGTRVTNLNAYVDGAFSDGIISFAEREALETHIERLNAEKAEIDAKYNNLSFNINLTGTPRTNLTTAKTDTTTGYDKAHTDLITAINNAIADSTITNAERTAVNNAFSTYRSRLSTFASRYEQAISSIETVLTTAAENNAKIYANNLKTQIDAGINAVETRVTNLNTYVDGAFSDGIISTAEKEGLKSQIQQLNNEKAQFDAKYNYIYADSFLVGTAKTNLSTAKTDTTTGYNKAHSDLITVINDAIADNTITIAERMAVSTAFTTYRTRLSTLVLRLEEAIVSLEMARAVRTENSAKTYTDALRTDINSEIDSIELRLSNLSGDLGEAFADNIINAAEKESLKAHIQNLNNEKTQLDSKYTSIYNNTFLTGTSKSNLATAKTDSTLGYNKAHTDLVAAINNAIADSIIVESERTAVTNAFNTYRTRLTTLATRFEEAINNINIAMIAQAEANSKNYTDGKDTTLRSNLRLTAPLPTSLTLDANGITAQTTTANKFARLDYRGLYIQGGAIQIDGGLPDNQIASATDWNTQGTYIDGSGIYTGTIQATQINTTTLSAISANLGTINGGSLNLTGGLKIVNGSNDVLLVENEQVVLNVSNLTINARNIADELDTKASNDSMQDTVNTVLESISEELASKIGEELFEEFRSANDGEISLVKNSISSIEQNSSNIMAKVVDTEDLVTSLGTFKNEVISYMNFSSSDMLVIGKSSSPFKIQITNEQINFINGETTLAYMNGDTLYITQAEVKNSILIGKHRMESDSTGTVFRWAGN